MDRSTEPDDPTAHGARLAAAPGIPPRADAVVVGAGLAGLTAAALIAERGHDVVVLDGTLPGGRARTDEQEGFRFNRGPHALYDAGAARRVMTGLGVRTSGGPPPTKASFVRLGDELAVLPVTPSQMLTSGLLGVREKAQLVRFLRTVGGARPASELSTATWLAQCRLTGRAYDMVAWLVRLTSYCAELDRLSADAAAEQLAIGLAGVTYLDGGWQSLVDSLLERGERLGVQVVTGVSVRALRDTVGGWALETAPGELTCRSVVLAAGGPAEAARLLGSAGVPAEALPLPGDALTAAALDLGLRRPLRQAALLFSFDEPLYLSQHAPPAALAPPGGAVVHALRYGARDARSDRADLVAHAAAARIDLDQVVAQRFLARMVVAHSVPTPERGGLAGRPPVAVADAEGAFLAGDWVGGRGQLADASVASAEEAAEAVHRFLTGPVLRSNRVAGSRP
jgi:phytoene dehydrogenase-like protein